MDCRSSCCRLELGWASREEAARHYDELLTSPTRQNCGFFTLLSEAPDARGAHSQTVFLSCR